MASNGSEVFSGPGVFSGAGTRVFDANMGFGETGLVVLRLVVGFLAGDLVEDFLVVDLGADFLDGEGFGVTVFEVADFKFLVLEGAAFL